MIEKDKIKLLRAIKIFVLFGIPLLGVLYAYQFTGQSREELIPFQTFKSPHVELMDPLSGLNRPRIELKFKDPVTVVNFWATWCPPCVEEFPAMIELQRQLEGQGVRLIFISVDDDWRKVEKFSNELGVPLKEGHFYWDPERKAAIAWGSSKFPETYVVRRDGWVLEKIIGLQQWTRPAVIEYFLDLKKRYLVSGG